MGASNYQSALSKRHSKLTGLLEDAKNSIARIKAEHDKLPQLEAKIAELEPLIQSLRILFESGGPRMEARSSATHYALEVWHHADPIWQRQPERDAGAPRGSSTHVGA